MRDLRVKSLKTNKSTAGWGDGLVGKVGKVGKVFSMQVWVW